MGRCPTFGDTTATPTNTGYQFKMIRKKKKKIRNNFLNFLYVLGFLTFIPPLSFIPYKVGTMLGHKVLVLTSSRDWEILLKKWDCQWQPPPLPLLSTRQSPTFSWFTFLTAPLSCLFLLELVTEALNMPQKDPDMVLNGKFAQPYSLLWLFLTNGNEFLTKWNITWVDRHILLYGNTFWTLYG